MIKRFIDRVESMGTEAWMAILNYIDTNIDELHVKSSKNEKKIQDLRDEFEELKEEFGDAKAIIDSNTELTKTLKKGALTTVVGIIITYIGVKLGLVG